MSIKKDINQDLDILSLIQEVVNLASIKVVKEIKNIEESNQKQKQNLSGRYIYEKSYNT